MKKKHNIRPQTIAIIVVMALVMLLLLNHAFDRIRKLYTDLLYDNALELKTNHLEDTVGNLLKDIETEREVWLEEFTDQVESCEEYVRLLAKEAEVNPEREVRRYFESRPDRENWTYMAYNSATNRVITDNKGLLGDSWDGNVQELQSSFISYDMFTVGGVTIIYGITQATLDDYVKNSIIKKIRYNEFDGNTWIWINKIRNYDGGKNYAECVVNPEDKSSAGWLLSTGIKDADGREYLKEELEALKKGGSCLYTYRQKAEDGIPSYRVVYSSLFKDYDWIISMGSDMGDLAIFLNARKTVVEQYMIRFEAAIVIIFIVLLGIMTVMILKSDRKFSLKVTRRLKKQVELDTLTKATSRQYGEEILKQSFESFKKGKNGPHIMLLDVDHFKEINDTYGHDVGDVVLKRVVTALYHTFRKSDYLVRWGGDEFVGLYFGLGENDVQAVARRVMEAVHSVKVVTQDNTEIALTASVGIAAFSSGDRDYTDGLKRADNMLYESKAGGRNQFHIAEKDARIDENKSSDKISRN